MCLQLAWRGTLLQVPQVFSGFSYGVRKCESAVGWVWVGYHRLLLVGLEPKCLAFAVGIYLGRGRTSRRPQCKKLRWTGPKPWLTDKPVTYDMGISHSLARTSWCRLRSLN